MLGKATYDEDNGLVPVTALTPTKGATVTTQGGHANLQAIAKHLLRALIFSASA